MKADGSFLGRGWAFPPFFGPGGAEVSTVSDAEDVRQSLQILLCTCPGERLMREAFGCDLASMQFHELDHSLVSAIEQLVSSAILEHEPRVEAERVEVRSNHTLSGIVTIEVDYRIRATNSRFNLVFPFYQREAGPVGP